MTDIAAMANAEREALLADLRSMTDAEWSATTCCDPWTVKHLVAHLTALGNQTAPNFFVGLIRNRFSFDRFVDGDLQKYHALSNADLLEAYAKTVEHPRTPPGPKYVSLGELMTHGDDIRRAIGRPTDHPAAHIEALGPLYARTGRPVDGRRRAGGLTLRAIDADWTEGDGPEVAGPGIDLIRAMTGRADGLAECNGPGLEALRARCA